MRRLIVSALLVLVLGACGDNDGASEATPATPQAEATATSEVGHGGGYSQGVRDYYGGSPPPSEEGSLEDVEAEYHQPPKPPQAGLGETITLTGSNIGVRMRVTVTGVEPVSQYQAVALKLESTGITNYEGVLENAAVTYGDGEPRKVAEGASAACSKDFAPTVVFIAVGATARGCLLFPASGSERPKRFQLALETVPVDAGGIWNLR